MVQSIFFKVRISISHSSKPTYNVTDTLLVHASSLYDLDNILKDYSETCHTYFNILSIEVLHCPDVIDMYSPMPFNYENSI